jgi:hypothetical protein
MPRLVNCVGVERARRRRWGAVTFDEQRRPLVRAAGVVGIARDKQSGPVMPPAVGIPPPRHAYGGNVQFGAMSRSVACLACDIA